MKRLILLLSVSILISYMLMGCSMQSAMMQYEVLQVGGYDGEDGGTHASEFQLWDSSLQSYHQDSSAPKTTTVTFDGKTYSGEYSRSVVVAPTLYKAHVYKGDGVKFEINASTGDLTDILFYNTETLVHQYDETACKQIADNIAAEYIDINDFSVETVIRDDSILFDYYRTVNGYKTTDELFITINCEGNVSYFGYFTLNDFENCELTAFFPQQAEQLVYDKLDSIYPASSNRTSSEIQSVVLVKMEDGSVAFYYTVNNEFKNGNMQYGSVVNLLVKQK